MGCLQSKSATPTIADSAKKSRRSIPNDAGVQGVTDKATYQPQLTTGSLRVGVCTAAWPVHTYKAAYHDVRIEDDHLFIAAFVGQFGEQPALYCVERAFQIFQTTLQEQGENISKALTETFKRLDENFLSNTAIPAQVRASCGASGTILYLDFKTSQCHTANVGTCQVLINSAVGSFAAGWSKGSFIAHEHTLRNDLERRRLQRLFPTEKGLFLEIGGNSTVRGVTNLTRCIGFGCLKNQDLADVHNASFGTQLSGRGYLTSDPTVLVCPLDRDMQHIVLLSEGMWGVTSPHDVALGLHCFEQFQREQLEKLFIANSQSFNVPAASSVKVMNELLMEQTPDTNSAEHLIQLAVSKVANRLSRQLKVSSPLTLDDIAQVQRSATTSQGDVPSSTGNVPKRLSSLRQRALFDDLHALVVSLSWPVSLGPLRFSALKVAKAVDLYTRDVERRWDLVRMMANFYRTRRRVILRRWWDVTAEAMKVGKKQAKVIEEKLWREKNMTVQVSPSLRVRDTQTGREFAYKDITNTLHNRF